MPDNEAETVAERLRIGPYAIELGLIGLPGLALADEEQADGPGAGGHGAPAESCRRRIAAGPPTIS